MTSQAPGTPGNDATNTVMNGTLVADPDVMIGPAMNRASSMTSLSDMTSPPKRHVVSFFMESPYNVQNSGKPKKHLKGRHSRSVALSYCYAIVIVLLGFVFPMAEALQGSLVTDTLAGGFRSYLYALSAFFFVYETVLHSVDKKRRRRKINKLVAIEKSAAADRSPDGQLAADVEGVINEVFEESDTEAPPQTSDGPQPSNRSSAPHLYQRRLNHDNVGAGAETCSNPDDVMDEVYDQILLQSGSATFSHEGTSIYLRIGCTVFAIANLVYVSLRIEKTRRDRLSPECADGIDNAEFPHYFHLVFIVVQTFFLLKNDRLLVVRYKPLLRFGLMHAMATNMCVWLRFLILEVIEGLHAAEEETGATHNTVSSNNSTSNETCPGSAFANVAPYLFPFILEYSLIALGTLAVMFTTVNMRITRDWVKSITKAIYRGYREQRRESLTGSAPSGNGPNQASRESTPAAHHHRKDDPLAYSHAGLFLGLIILAGVIVSMVLFFYWENSEFEYESLLSYSICELLLEACILAGTIAGLVQFSGFVYDETINNTIDHALLLISGTGLLLLETFLIVASCFLLETPEDYHSLCITLAGSLTAFVGCLTQTALILDGMQRRAVDKQDIAKKKGRAVVTFLIVVNISAWIFSSFEKKRVNFVIYEDFYGEVAWSIIFNAALPLELFFRFHCSACLADMWHNPYTPEHED